MTENISNEAASSSSTPNWRQRLWNDVKEATVACVLGLALMAVIDLVWTIWVAPSPVRLMTMLHLIPLEFTLAALLFPFALPLMIGLAVAVRVFQGNRELRGFFGSYIQSQQASKAAGWIWGLSISLLCYLAASTVLTLKVSAMFKEPQLTALVLAFLQLVLFGILIAMAAGIAKGIYLLGQRCHSKLNVFNPFGSPPAASVAIAIIAWPIMRLILNQLPLLEPYVPWRKLLSFACFSLGAYAATHLLAKRGGLWPAPRAKRRIAVGVAAALSLFFIPMTLVSFGADPDTKALAISSSPTMASSMNLLRRMTDFDNDGFGSLLGENDCAAFDSKIHPLARDIPDNGIDENCDGRDFKLGILPSYKTGEKMPVPDAYLDDWNVLLLTIDTVRFDHTSFGNYSRDTTPNLAEFVKRSANFTFANAPSAGTMASIPAILTSKFFHSGIALNEDIPRGSPPILMDSNLLLPELFKSKGYRTGAILSHEYFNKWGMEQGVDDYDNTVGKKRAPFAVTSEKLTNRAISWIGKQRKKWFLWVHYIDPHGRYVAHPGETNYGDSEMDLYDGELHFTDKHMGNLLDYVARSQSGKKTIIIITSDHGDAFGEHGYINHAQDLHRELLHVPLIFYVPNIEPRDIPGAVSPIDIFPTLADLIGYDLSAISIEGESLVPQLFYGKDAHHRTVFSETNYPKPLRAAVNSRYKLILDLKNNVSRLFDLKKDPLEKKNVWTSDKKGYKEMRGYLSEWIERVVYSRDTASNQAIAKLADNLVRKRPSTATEVKEVSLDGDHVIIDSIEFDKADYKPGDKISLAVYFKTITKTTFDMKFQVEAWLETDSKTARSIRSPLRFTAKGMFPTSRWHEGELVRDRFTIKIPANWNVAADKTTIHFGIRARNKTGGANKGTLTWKGKLKEGSKDLLLLGSIPLANPTPVVPLPSPAPPAKGVKTKLPVGIQKSFSQKKLAPVSKSKAKSLKK